MDLPSFLPSTAAVRICEARADVRLTQTALAEMAGVSTGYLQRLETGRATPNKQTLFRILEAASYRPSIPLARLADEIVAVAEKLGLSNVRVFGSCVRGEDRFDSDVDLVVHAGPETTLFELGAFSAAVSALTGFPADIVTDRSRSLFAISIYSRAEPL